MSGRSSVPRFDTKTSYVGDLSLNLNRWNKVTESIKMSFLTQLQWVFRRHFYFREQKWYFDVRDRSYNQFICKLQLILSYVTRSNEIPDHLMIRSFRKMMKKHFPYTYKDRKRDKVYTMKILLKKLFD